MASFAGKDSTPGLPSRLSRGIDIVLGRLPVIGKDLLALPQVKRTRLGIGAAVGSLVFAACMATGGRLPAVTYYPTSTPRPSPTEALTPTPIQVFGPFDPTDTPRPIPTLRPTSTQVPLRPVDTATAPKPADTATAPKPADTATAPKPADTATAPKPADTATAPKPADTATAPKPADTATAPKPTIITEGTIMSESEKVAYIDGIKSFLKEVLPTGTTVQSFDLGTVTGTKIRMFSVVAADINSPHQYASELFVSMSKSNQNIVFTADENLKMLEMARKYISQTIPIYPGNEGLFVSVKATDYKIDPLKLLEKFKLSDRTRYSGKVNNTGSLGIYKSHDGKVVFSVTTGSEVASLINGKISRVKPEGAIRIAVAGIDAFNSKTMIIKEEDWGFIVEYTGKALE